MAWRFKQALRAAGVVGLAGVAAFVALPFVAVEFPPSTDVWYPSEIFPPNTSRTSHNWPCASLRVSALVPKACPSQIAA
jgi:hypothetical protein